MKLLFNHGRTQTALTNVRAGRARSPSAPLGRAYVPRVPHWIVTICAFFALAIATLVADPAITVSAKQGENQSVAQSSCGGANWVEIATLCTVLIGGAFAWWQWRQNCHVSHAEHLNDILERYGSKRMTDLFYRLVNNTTYGGEDSEVFYLGGLRFQDIKGNMSEDNIRENDIDSVLLLFAQICHEHEQGTISDSEFAFFCYQIHRTLAHKQFKQYLFDLSQHCGKFKIAFPYRALAKEGLNVDREFYQRVLAQLETHNHKIMKAVKEMLP